MTISLQMFYIVNLLLMYIVGWSLCLYIDQFFPFFLFIYSCWKKAEANLDGEGAEGKLRRWSLHNSLYVIAARILYCTKYSPGSHQRIFKYNCLCSFGTFLFYFLNCYMVAHTRLVKEFSYMCNIFLSAAIKKCGLDRCLTPNQCQTLFVATRLGQILLNQGENSELFTVKSLGHFSNFNILSIVVFSKLN